MKTEDRMLVKTCLLVACVLGLSACSKQETYRIGQEWQKYECSRLSDARERSQCMERADLPYEEYQDGMEKRP